MRLIRTSAFRFLSICIVLAMCICSFGIQPSAEKVGAHVKEYYKYDYATGERTSYTLSQDILTNDANEDEADAQSDESRVPGGNSGVVKLVIDGDTASGFIIDDHIIATAAHCCIEKYKEPYGDIKVLLFADAADRTPAASIRPVEIHVPVAYLTTDVGEYGGVVRANDYALITVAEDLSAYEHYDLGTVTDAFEKSGRDVTVTGFPETVGSQKVNTATQHQMYTDSGTIEEDTWHIEGSDGRVLLYKAKITGGNSGGPIYVTTTYQKGKTIQTKKTAIGVVIAPGYSKNEYLGVRILPEILKFYKSNDYVNYA